MTTIVCHLTLNAPKSVTFDVFDDSYSLIIFMIYSHFILLGLHALSSFASSHQAALETIMNDNILLESWLSLLNSGKVEILTAALSSVARVIDMGSETPSGSRSKASQLSSLLVMQGTSESKASSSAAESSASSSSGLVALKKRIIAEIGKVKGVPAVAYLMKTARQPVNERKQAVYALMTALCRQQPGGWGLMVLYGTQGFREFIEDRSTEHTKEGKEAKFWYAYYQHCCVPVKSKFDLMPDLISMLNLNQSNHQKCDHVNQIENNDLYVFFYSNLTPYPLSLYSSQHMYLFSA